MKESVFISAPFGNYIHFKKAISVRGTYTLEPRLGRLKQILKTLRINKHGWINALGLRNPGIKCGLGKINIDNEVLSIAAIHKDDWRSLHRIIPDNIPLEFNLSCPNVDEAQHNWDDIIKFLNPKRKWTILKISPLTTCAELNRYYEMGFRQFHCSNTLPTPKGGQSGRLIQSFNKHLIKHLKDSYDDTEVIGGGGIFNMNDISFYRNLKVDHFSLGTVCFNPIKLFNLNRKLYK